MALKCSTFTTCSQLICPKRPIPFCIPQPLQLKKKHLAVTSLLLPPHYSLSLLYSPPPIISLFQICNLLFISFLCLVGCASLHLIKMYIFKSFFKGKLFAKRTRAMPHVTGNYSETEQNQTAHLPLAGHLLCVGLATLCYTAANQVNWTLYIFSHYFTVYHCFLRFENANQPLGTTVNLFSGFYNIKYLSLQHPICTQKPKQNT